MSITGNMKFFDKNRIDSTCTFTLTSASASLVSYLYDNSRINKLTSIGSNDSTPEVIVVTFPSSKTFNRIFIDNHNIKSGKIEYWNGSAYVDFSSAISWSSNTATTNYFEFNSVSTTKILLTMNTTQTANAEKYVGELRCFSELGTLEYNPSALDQRYDEKSVERKTATGGSMYVIFGKKWQADITFPDLNTNDLALVRTLKENAQSFYIYPCGGITTYTQDGFRVQDMFFVNYINAFNPNLKRQILDIGTSVTMSLSEV